MKGNGMKTKTKKKKHFTADDLAQKYPFGATLRVKGFPEPAVFHSEEDDFDDDRNRILIHRSDGRRTWVSASKVLEVVASSKQNLNVDAFDDPEVTEDTVVEER